MGTHATIIVERVKFAKVYKHWDGSPQSTLQWLIDFNKSFVENRGNDFEYKFAQLLRSSVRDAEKYNLDTNEFLGWGVVPYNSGPGDYEYVLHIDGTVSFKRHV